MSIPEESDDHQEGELEKSIISKMSRRKNILIMIMFILGIAMILSVFLPWISIDTGVFRATQYDSSTNTFLVNSFITSSNVFSGWDLASSTIDMNTYPVHEVLWTSPLSPFPASPILLMISGFIVCFLSILSRLGSLGRMGKITSYVGAIAVFSIGWAPIFFLPLHGGSLSVDNNEPLRTISATLGALTSFILAVGVLWTSVMIRKAEYQIWLNS